jgi:hypothetical protein
MELAPRWRLHLLYAWLYIHEQWHQHRNILRGYPDKRFILLDVGVSSTCGGT